MRYFEFFSIDVNDPFSDERSYKVTISSFEGPSLDGVNPIRGFLAIVNMPQDDESTMRFTYLFNGGTLKLLKGYLDAQSPVTRWFCEGFEADIQVESVEVQEIWVEKKLPGAESVYAIRFFSDQDRKKLIPSPTPSERAHSKIQKLAFEAVGKKVRRSIYQQGYMIPGWGFQKVSVSETINMLEEFDDGDDTERSWPQDKREKLRAELNRLEERVSIWFLSMTIAKNAGEAGIVSVLIYPFDTGVIETFEVMQFDDL